MASDVTVDDLTGTISMTEIISVSRLLPTRFPTEVWKGTHTFRGRSAVVAIKIMKQMMLPDYEPSYLRLQKETRTISKCNHPNLVQFIGISYKLDEEQGMCAPCLITRFYRNGSIMEYLAKPENANAVRMNLLRQIFAGLAHLHSKSIVHGNLKPTNILISDNDNAKLADYGLSPIPPDQEYESSILELELPLIRYKAPELIFPGENNKPHPTTQSDVWAASMVGLEILSGKIPYAQYLRDSELLEAMEASEILPERIDYPGPSVGDGAWTAFQSCWKWDSSERPTIQKLKNYFDCHYGPSSTQGQEVVFIMSRACD